MWKKLAVLSTLVVALAFIVGSAPFLVPTENYKPSLEKIVSDAIGRQVRIGQLRYQLTPLPHLVGTNVTLWSPKRKGEAVIASIEIWLEPQDLLQKKVTVKRVHFSGFSTNQAFIESFIEEWQQMQPGDESTPAWVALRRISAEAITVRTHDNHLIGPFRFDGRFGGEYGFRSLKLAMLDDHLDIDIEPTPEGLSFHVDGKNFTPPFGPKVFLDRVRAQGFWSGATVNISTIEVAAYGGETRGDFVLEWYDGSWQTRGRWQARNVNLDPINTLVGTRTLSGVANGAFTFQFKGPSAFEILQQIHIAGDIAVGEGVLYGEEPLFQFSELQTHAVLTNEHLELSEFSATAYDGRFTSKRLKVNWNRGWSIQGDLATHGVDVASLLDGIPKMPRLEGQLDSELRVSLANEDINKLLEAPDIRGHARLTNAILYAIESPADTSSLAAPHPWIELPELDLTGTFGRHKINAATLHAKGYGGEIIGENVMFAWAPQLRLTGAIKTRNLNTAQVLALFDIGPYVTGDATGNFDLALEGNNTDEFLRSARVNGQIQISDGKIPKVTSFEQKESRAIWLAFDHLAGKFRLEQQSVRFKTLTMNGYGGQILAHNAQFAWTDNWRLSALVDATHIDIAPIMRGFRESNTVSGTLTGRVAVKFQNPSPDALFTKPVLAGKFLIENGVVHKTDLEKASRGGDENPDKDKTEFDKLAGVLFVKDEVLRFSSIEIESPSLRARGQLKVQADEKIKGSMEVGLRSTGGLMSIPINISGDTDKPSLSLSGGVVFGGALGTSLLGPGLGTIVGVGTGKFFSGLANLFTHSKEDSDRESQVLKDIEQELAHELKMPAQTDS